ncbi:hypothetical protein GW17_00047780 [Ensete ventricosum]|nr:hypothetical protein GW17_00047780 [Ensete ventricosum]
MKLNYVESFNVFTARTARRRGWLQGAAGCGHGPRARWLPATCKGRPPVGATARKGRPPASTVACGQITGAAANDAPARDGRQWPARKRLPTTHPQGAAGSRGGGIDRRGGRPLAAWLHRNTQCRRLRRGSGDGGDAGG